MIGEKVVYQCFFCKGNGKEKSKTKSVISKKRKKKEEEDNNSDSEREYYERDYDVEEVQDKRIIDVLNQ